MLVDENGISVGVEHDKTRGAGGAFVSFRHQRHALRFELTLQLAHVGELRKRLRVAVPTAKLIENAPSCMVGSVSKGWVKLHAAFALRVAHR